VESVKLALLPGLLPALLMNRRASEIQGTLQHCFGQGGVGVRSPPDLQGGLRRDTLVENIVVAQGIQRR